MIKFEEKKKKKHETKKYTKRTACLFRKRHEERLACGSTLTAFKDGSPRPKAVLRPVQKAICAVSREF